MKKVKRNEKLIQVLKDKWFKDYKVAESAGIDSGDFSRIKHGRINPTQTEMENIAEALSVDVEDIF